jgi:hypothetical protein
VRRTESTRKLGRNGPEAIRGILDARPRPLHLLKVRTTSPEGLLIKLALTTETERFEDFDKRVRQEGYYGTFGMADAAAAGRPARNGGGAGMSAAAGLPASAWRDFLEAEQPLKIAPEAPT